jgi:hypothetical protein
MQVLSDKDFSQKKKPVQVYFESEVLSMIQLKLSKSKSKKSMAEYIRELVEADLEVSNSRKIKRKWDSVPLDLNLSKKSSEIDNIVYGS